ncbi:hypothetical protein [Proteus mirabilis]|uniref:hypothetical protein n=1 Tax=Proteus mirabilis TaxID=584 RepID=UPI00073CC7CF|nr:hypothetical protein [Proteus mirabilis]KSY00266.1 hypothetical protein APT96_02735 [Proteus mirabilis]MBG6017244.1 hypothetical protein [Proteus mirabilis]MBG6043062.1 hypothetical protein [Proteus mirabilis]MBS3851771.1 hypothetical protein [Proteus mirabilis]MBS3856542.1 hypothetical protein [Proteus mirabilis]
MKVINYFIILFCCYFALAFIAFVLLGFIAELINYMKLGIFYIDIFFLKKPIILGGVFGLSFSGVHLFVSYWGHKH